MWVRCISNNIKKVHVIMNAVRLVTVYKNYFSFSLIAVIFPNLTLISQEKMAYFV